LLTALLLKTLLLLAPLKLLAAVLNLLLPAIKQAWQLSKLAD
jgi:hypothetical protein